MREKPSFACTHKIIYSVDTLQPELNIGRNRAKVLNEKLGVKRHQQGTEIHVLVLYLTL